MTFTCHISWALLAVSFTGFLCFGDLSSSEEGWSGMLHTFHTGDGLMIF